MSQPKYVCKICLKDLTRDVNGMRWSLFMEPEQTMKIHVAMCATKHKAELLDTFCQQWNAEYGERTQDLIEAVLTLQADWVKLNQLGKGE